MLKVFSFFMKRVDVQELYKRSYVDNNFERAEKRLNRERQTESRLFVIDAGLDPRKLREKYDDRTRFFITKGLVKPTYTYENKIKTVTGIVTKLSVESVHVPLKYRQLFDAILVEDNSIHNEFRQPRYSVTLANGSRFEPWIVSVQHMGE